MQQNSKLIFSILWEQVSSLFFVLLFISAIVSFFVGEKVDGTIIAVILFINTLLGFIQEFRASRATDKLLRLVEARVYVFRSGKLVEIKTSELVVDDIIHLTPGSIVPVDVEVMESESGMIDESVRTGETLPETVNMGDKIYAGAVVVSGKLVARTLNTEGTSSLDVYREKLESVKKWSSFDIFTNSVVRYVFVVALIALVFSMFFLVFWMGKYDSIHYFVFAIAMLVGVVPEMLPLMITIILTRESVALAREKVIVKRLSALESLGAVEYLLTDKTGTITENKLRVVAVSEVENFWEISNSITEGEYERTALDTAYDRALDSSLGKIKTPTKKIKTFIPFDRARGYETFVLDGGQKVVRGIVAKVLEICRLDNKKILSATREYEKKGMRVLALAESLAGEWRFAGFVAFFDPIKATARDSVALALRRGIKVKILTGDSLEVAESVASDLKLIDHKGKVVSLEKTKIADLSDDDLKKIVLFGRCTPENKLELMDRYLKLGPVAFLGDGINDALALRRADVGIAVNNATDIAKESADIILLEKDLAPILKSVSTGRRALRNILTYIMYTLSGNAGNFLSLIVASFYYPELPMLPIQVLLNNLLSDLPLMLIITDNPDEYALSHVPHFEPKKIMKRVVIFGLISSLFDLTYFYLYMNAGVAEFQTGWFFLSLLTELILVLSIRSSRPMWKAPALSIPLLLGITISCFLPFAFIYSGVLSEIFKFAPLNFATVLTIICMIVVYATLNEVAKFFMRHKNLYNKPIKI